MRAKKEVEGDFVRNGEFSKAFQGQNDAVVLLCVQEAYCGVVNEQDSQGDTRQGGQSEWDPWQLPAARADGSWHGSTPTGKPSRRPRMGLYRSQVVHLLWPVLPVPPDSCVLAALPVFLWG